MDTKVFLLVLRSRGATSCYLSSSTFSASELKDHILYLDSIGLDLVDIIPVSVDLSQYDVSVVAGLSVPE